jgi:hypothetical protein
LSRLKCTDELQHMFYDSVKMTQTIYTFEKYWPCYNQCHASPSNIWFCKSMHCLRQYFATDWFNQETYPQHESFDANIPIFFSVQNSSTPRKSIRHWTFSLSTSPTLKSAIARGVGSAFRWSRKHLEHSRSCRRRGPVRHPAVIRILSVPRNQNLKKQL